jgi:hypothetical protein
MRANTRDEHFQFVCDDTSISVFGSQHCDASTATAGRDEDDSRLHLDHNLSHSSAPKPLTSGARQAVHPGRNRGQVLGVLPSEPARAGNQNPVARQHLGLIDPGHSINEVIHQPADVNRLAHALNH